MWAAQTTALIYPAISLGYHLFYFVHIYVNLTGVKKIGSVLAISG